MSDGTYEYEYDDEGNRKSRKKIVDGVVDSYVWDYRNRLVSIVTKDAGGVTINSVGYEYDADDERVKKSVSGGVVENYVIDRGQIAAVTDGSGVEMFHYLYGLNVDAVLAQDSSTGMVWSLADRLGSIDSLTDEDGVVVDRRTFDSFGRVLSQSNPSVAFRYGYTGRERDLESGLDYYRARYYDSNVGRFISVDPMGFGAGDTNLYRYVGNGVTNATDPSGEFIWVPFAVAAVGGAILGAYQNYSYQNAQVADGQQSKINYGNVVASGVIGAAIAPALAYGVTVAPYAAPLLAASGIFSGIQSHNDAQAAANAGNINTALYLEKTAYFDVFSAGLFHGSHPSSPSMQPALAQGIASFTNTTSSSLAGVAAGAGLMGAGVVNDAKDIFQHFFAASTSGSSDASFTVDSMGRTVEARGKITGTHPKRSKDYTPVPSVGGSSKQTGDHKGHLIQENAVDNPDLVNVRENIIWESQGSNLKDKRAFERYAIKIAESNRGSDVQTIHEPLYKNNEMRPYAVTHSVEVDGVVVHSVSIYNR